MNCIIIGCEKPSVVRGWCRMHYTRWQRHGDPTKKLYSDVAFVGRCVDCGRELAGIRNHRFRKNPNRRCSDCWKVAPKTFRRTSETRQAMKLALEIRLGKPEERFWKRVKKTNACWTWEGRRERKLNFDYGSLQVSGKKISAHRFSWELHYGPVPKGFFVLHRCDNPPCVNPNHLFLGTQKDNLQDMAKKGRASSGPRKITDEDVLAIRRTSEPNRMIASRFKISPSQVSRIKNLRRWKYL